MFVCQQRAGRARRSYSVVVAGVEGPVRFHPRAAGNPVARLRGKKAGACTPLPTSFFAAQCAGVGIIHILQALRVELRLLGVDVDVHAVRAAAAVRAHNREPIAWRGEENTTKMEQLGVVSTEAQNVRKEKAAPFSPSVPQQCGNLGTLTQTFLVLYRASKYL